MPSDVAAIRSRHYQIDKGTGFETCGHDHRPWPCDAVQLLAIIDGLRPAVEALPDGVYATGEWNYRSDTLVNRDDVLALLPEALHAH